MHRSSSFRSTLNTSYIRGLGMCKVCTEAVVFHSSTLLSFYSSILLLFRSVALLCCCSSILLARRNLASSSFSIDRLTSADLGWPRLTSADLGWPRLTSADLGWPRLTSADLDRRKFAHTTSWHNGLSDWMIPVDKQNPYIWLLHMQWIPLFYWPVLYIGWATHPGKMHPGNFNIDTQKSKQKEGLEQVCQCK